MNYSVTLSWTPEAFVKDLEQRTANGLNAAAGVLARQIAANVVDRPQGLAGFAGSRGGASRRKTVGAGGSVVSEPGQYPSNQTGALRASIRVLRPATAGVGKSTPGSLVAVVGSTLGQTRRPYDRFLEYGTRKMEARPFIHPAIQACRSRMQSAFFTAARGALGSSSAGSPLRSYRPLPSLSGAAR